MQWIPPTVFVFLIAALAVVGLLFFRTRVHHSKLSKHNDVAGVLFTIVATLYAVLLAFVVIVVWENLGKAEERAAQEAGIVGDLIRDADLFPDPERTQLENELREYVKAVIDDEWPAMANNGSSPKVSATLDKIFKTFSAIQPTSPRDVNIHLEMLTRLNQVSYHRRLRLVSADNKVPSLMWVVLIIGGVITVGFSYVLGVEHGRWHALMTGALAIMIALGLYLIMAIDHPFAGTIKVDPDAFQLVLDNLE